MNAVWPAKATTLVLIIGRTSGGGRLFIVAKKAWIVRMLGFTEVCASPGQAVSREPTGRLTWGSTDNRKWRNMYQETLLKESFDIRYGIGWQGTPVGSKETADPLPLKKTRHE